MSEVGVGMRGTECLGVEKTRKMCWRDDLPDLLRVGIVRGRGACMICPCGVLRAFHGLAMCSLWAAAGTERLD